MPNNERLAHIQSIGIDKEDYLKHCREQSRIYRNRKKYELLLGQDGTNLKPEMLTDILNAQQRADFVKKLGLQKILDAFPYKEIDTEGNYKLVEIAFDFDTAPRRRNGDTAITRDRTQHRYLIMKNPSTNEHHIEGVPNEIQTVEQAILWRNGLIETDDLETKKYDGDIKPVILT